MENIFVAAFAAIASIAGSYLANRKSTALMEYRLSEVEKNIAILKDDKTEINALRTDIEVLDERLKAASTRIKVLEDAN